MTGSPDQPSPGPALVIVGPPGVGKSTVGRLVAQVLGVDARDTDDDVQQESGVPVSELFVSRGEPAFRALERTAVVRALAEHRGVLTLGGGAVEDGRTRTDLASCTVAFLDVSLSDAMRRLGMNRSRPLLLGNVRQQWTQLLQARRPLYDEVATFRIDTSGRSCDEVAAEISQTLGALGLDAPGRRSPR